MPLRWLLVTAIALIPGTTDLRPQGRPDLPPPAWQPTGPRVTWKGVSFVVPPGMRGAAQASVYDMVGLGMRGRGGQCSLVIFDEIPSRGDLATHAHSILVEIMTGFGRGIADSQGGSNLIGDRRVGRSADGWRYVELNGMITPGGDGRARIMLIDRGATVVPIVAVSTPTNGCVGLSVETTPNSNTITWSALYYSLKLSGSTPSDHLREQIIGIWEGSGMAQFAGGGMIQEEVYAPNGRYGGASIGATAAGQPFSSSSGGGRYVVDADKLAVFPTAGQPAAHLVRVVEDYSLMTPSRSTVRLCRVKVDEAGPNERCLPRS